MCFFFPKNPLEFAFVRTASELNSHEALIYTVLEVLGGVAAAGVFMVTHQASRFAGGSQPSSSLGFSWFCGVDLTAQGRWFDLEKLGSVPLRLFTP